MHLSPSRLAGLSVIAALAVGTAGCGASSDASDKAASPAAGSEKAAAAAPLVDQQEIGGFGTEYEKTGSGPMVEPTVPDTPSVKTEMGRVNGNFRTYDLTAEQITQKIANFPLQRAKVWGYNGSSPGPTLVAYEGETMRVVVTNDLPEPTTIHLHGLHQPNDQDGVAGISQPNPIPPGGKKTYTVSPGHVGTFAYHSHFETAVQDQRGLAGMITVLPKQEHESVKADVDVVMTLQIWGWKKNGDLVKPFGVGPGGKFPFDTINGKTGDNSGGPIEIKKGDLVRIRVYNASQETHAMHMHGHDIVAVSKNGHAIPPVRETTQTVNPGDFYELEFRADNPGNWVFHCHFPHHTANGMASGYHGAPVGMTRVFSYKGYTPKVSPKYFSKSPSVSKTL